MDKPPHSLPAAGRRRLENSLGTGGKTAVCLPAGGATHSPATHPPYADVPPRPPAGHGGADYTARILIIRTFFETEHYHTAAHPAPFSKPNGRFFQFKSKLGYCFLLAFHDARKLFVFDTLWDLAEPAIPFADICFFFIIAGCLSAWLLTSRVKLNNLKASDGKFKSNYARRMFPTRLTMYARTFLGLLIGSYMSPLADFIWPFG